MDRLLIEGGNRLVGEVQVSGAKNAALPLMAAALLADGTTTLTNVPRLGDIETFSKLLRVMGCRVERDEEAGSLTITPGDAGASTKEAPEAPYDLVKTMRASILVLGPLAARHDRARVSLPGGCAIGERPVDLHMKGLRKMGATVHLEHGYIVVEGGSLKGTEIYLDMPTVTGTENLMLAATLADGETTLENAAMEPEITALADALVKMGAQIRGAGSERITITGVDELKATKHRVIPDRIEAGTFMVAAAMTKGNVLIKDCPLELLDSVAMKLGEAGTEVKREDGGVRVIGDWPIGSVDIKTLPYPGFPTDMQAQMMAFMVRSKGLSVITETVFENRFMHVGELKRMGADISVDGRNAVVKGVPRLGGAELMATDLRASASLVLAGLVGEGETVVSRIYHLDRGDDSIEKKLSALGAEIKREKQTKADEK